jgi:hypothetical protein
LLPGSGKRSMCAHVPVNHCSHLTGLPCACISLRGFAALMAAELRGHLALRRLMVAFAGAKGLLMRLRADGA